MRKISTLILFIILIILLYSTYITVSKELHFRSFNNIANINGSNITIDTSEIEDTDESLTNAGDQMQVQGGLFIPSVGISLPIFISSNPDAPYNEMDNGIVFDQRTGLPNQGKELVLMGHRENQLKKLKHLKNGDEVYIVINDQGAKYKVTNQEHIKDTDRDKVYGKSDYEEVRLFTCYPLEAYKEIDGRWLVKARYVEELDVIYE